MSGAESTRQCEALVERLAPTTDDAATPPTFVDVVDVFSRRCILCHGGDAGQGGFAMGTPCQFDLPQGICVVDDTTFDAPAREALRATLLAPSNGSPSLPRVTPGQPQRSFLVLKLAGCQDALPELTGCSNCGERMPPNAALLADAPHLFDVVTRWVAAGAPDP